MNKIATHDSITGEKGYGLLSLLVWPFSVTQSKTLKEQYDAGCRFFDVRVRENKRGWICAHGLWTTKRTADDILSELNSYGDCYVQITYEGNDNDNFIKTVDKWKEQFPNNKLTTINTKLPKWKMIREEHKVPVNGQFIHLDYSSWHTYLPIPWLWKKIYHDKTEFNSEYFVMVDFL